jgi:hypothetical protein
VDFAFVVKEMDDLIRDLGAEVLIHHPSLVECMHTCLHDQTVGNVINAIRSVIAMLQIGN